MEGAHDPRGWHLERECPRPQAQWGGNWSGCNAPPHNFFHFAFWLTHDWTVHKAYVNNVTRKSCNMSDNQ